MTSRQSGQYDYHQQSQQQQRSQQDVDPDMRASRGVRLLQQSSSRTDLQNTSFDAPTPATNTPSMTQSTTSARDPNATPRDRNYVPVKNPSKSTLVTTPRTRSNSFVPPQANPASPYSRRQTDSIAESPRPSRQSNTPTKHVQFQGVPNNSQQSNNGGYSPRPQQYQQQPQLRRQNSFTGTTLIQVIPPPPAPVLVRTTITQPLPNITSQQRITTYQQPIQQHQQLPSHSPQRQAPLYGHQPNILSSNRTPPPVAQQRGTQQPYTSPFHETNGNRDSARSPYNYQNRNTGGGYNGRGASGSKLPPQQQARLDNVLARSQDDTRDIIEGTLDDETAKLRSEIEFLQQKLKLKDEEVNIFNQYVSEIKGQQQQNGDQSPVQSGGQSQQQYPPQQQSQYPQQQQSQYSQQQQYPQQQQQQPQQFGNNNNNNNNSNMRNSQFQQSMTHSQFPPQQQQQQQQQQMNSSQQRDMGRSSMNDYDMSQSQNGYRNRGMNGSVMNNTNSNLNNNINNNNLLQEDSSFLQKELQNQQWQNQQQQLQIGSLEKLYQSVKKQLDDKDLLIIRLQEQLSSAQRMNSSSIGNTGMHSRNREGDDQERIRKLEQENELYMLKIQSLERNFLHIEKEYRLLKEQKSGYY